MFMSNQVGFVAAGRWYLPLFKKNQGLEYDVVTWPTNTGNKIEPAGIPTAYMVMNKASKNKEAAYTFFSEYVSKEGQRFRLQGGGNAVPSVQERTRWCWKGICRSMPSSSWTRVRSGIP